MSKPRVTACKQRDLSHKKDHVTRPDEFVFSVDFPETAKSARLIFLLGKKEKLFTPDPVLQYVDPAYVKKMIAKATNKNHSKKFEAIDIFCSPRISLDQINFTHEEVTPDIIEALRDFVQTEEASKPKKPTKPAGFIKGMMNRFFPKPRRSVFAL